NPWERKAPTPSCDLKTHACTASGTSINTAISTKPTAEDLNRNPHAKGHNHAANRRGDPWVALGWGFSWPANRRLMYNRASADPAGNPWPKEARLAREYARLRPAPNPTPQRAEGRAPPDPKTPAGGGAAVPEVPRHG